ncbi:hypothetical protein TELCIR_15244 [Teladorsagia circumcincta]|uniref:Uncharacterized protein n=1 Tax=Teladorsagia circumcincta TaxID=45464 RepID=A0A2G9TYR0_TELCI|nr:hypothetical protein TELCIR_15244 [Teladorsagia circumcincta]
MSSIDRIVQIMVSLFNGFGLGSGHCTRFGRFNYLVGRNTGRCPRALDAEHLALVERWLTLLTEVLEPFQNVSPSQLDAIAPSHTVSRNVNDGMVQHHSIVSSQS